MAFAESELESAMSAYEEIADVDVEYLPDLMEHYLEIALAAGAMPRARGKLDEWTQRYQGISLVLKLTDFISQEQGPKAAGEFLVNALHKKPSVRGLNRLIEYRAAGYLPAETSDDILKAVTSRLMLRQPGYRCTHCGFSGQSHHWHCPSCRQWGTTRTIQGVLGE